MVQSLLANPILAIVVIIVAIILGKVLKLSAKVIWSIILIYAAYLIVTHFIL